MLVSVLNQVLLNLNLTASSPSIVLIVANVKLKDDGDGSKVACFGNTSARKSNPIPYTLLLICGIDISNIPNR
jgi:hypothetical protein